MITQSTISEKINRYFIGTLFITSLTTGAAMANALIRHGDAVNDADYGIYPAIGLAAACAQIGLFAWVNRRVRGDVAEHNREYAALTPVI